MGRVAGCGQQQKVSQTARLPVCPLDKARTRTGLPKSVPMCVCLDKANTHQQARLPVFDYKRKKIYFPFQHIYSVPQTHKKQVRFIGVVRKDHKCFMIFIITDKVVKILLLINSRYSIAQMCTWEDTRARLFTRPVLDDVMSQNELTTNIAPSRMLIGGYSDKLIIALQYISRQSLINNEYFMCLVMRA